MIKAHVVTPSHDYLPMYAHPFTLINETETDWCELKYVGPRWLMFGRNDTCIIPLTDLDQIDDNIYFEPSRRHCMKTSDKPNFALWKNGKCFPKSEANYKDFLQFKATPDGYLVFCYGANITINKASLPCPKYPIRIQDNVEVKLDGKELVSHTMHEVGHVKSKFL